MSGTVPHYSHKTGLMVGHKCQCVNNSVWMNGSINVSLIEKIMIIMLKGKRVNYSLKCISSCTWFCRNGFPSFAIKSIE